MTEGPAKMNCEDIDKGLKNFVSDLLPDAVYQSYIEHLDSCKECTNRVRSMGSFTNQLWELTDIEIPSDLDSTILFQFEKAKKEPRKPKGKKPKKLVIAAVIIIVGAALAFGAKKFFEPKELNVEQVTSDAVIVQTTPMKKKASDPDPEAEKLYKQLKGMADSLAPMAPAASEKKKPGEESAKESVKEREPEIVEKSVTSASAPASDAYSLHWHIPYFTEADIKQLVGTITMLNIDPDYEDNNFIIFRTINKRIKTIRSGIQFTHKIQLDTPNFMIDGSDPEGEVMASISFTGRDPTYSTSGSTGGLSSLEKEKSAPGNSQDWHIMLVSATQDVLLDIIKRNRGSIEYTSDDVVVFSMPGARIKALAEEIQGTGGLFPDFGNSDFETVSILGMVNVLVYFPEQ